MIAGLSCLSNGCRLQVAGAVLVVLAACAPERPDRARQSSDVWKLEPVARIVGADTGRHAFSVILDLQIGEGDAVWLLDRSQSLILFDSSGRAAREVARPGRGPSELLQSNGVRRAHNGEMWVRDFGNSRITRFSGAGDHVGQHHVPPHSYRFRWDGAIDTAGVVSDAIMRQLSATAGQDSIVEMVIRYPLASPFSADTALFPSDCSWYALPSSVLRGRLGGGASIPFAPSVRYHLTPEGGLWCGASDEYRLRYYPFGSQRATAEIGDSAPGIPIPKEVRDAAIAEFEQDLARLGGTVEAWSPGSVAHERGPIRSFSTDDSGNLWVLRERPDGHYAFDVWNGDGRKLATAALPQIGRPAELAGRVVRDRLVIVGLNDEDLPTVFLFKIVRSSTTVAPVTVRASLW